MTTTIDDREQELIDAIKDAESQEERLTAVRKLAKHNIERHRPIYDRLARK